jgi:hypothetical protein
MTRAAIAVVVLLAAGPAAGQQTRPHAAAAPRIVALDHLESKAVTAWIEEDAGGGRCLLVARVGAPVVTRLRAVGLRDLVLHPFGRTAFVAVEGARGAHVEEVVLEGTAEPRRLLTLDRASPIQFGRSADDVTLLASDGIYMIDARGIARLVFRRDDRRIDAVALDHGRARVATVRGGEIEIVASDGGLAGGLGPGHAPAFLDDGRLAFVRAWPDGLLPDAGGGAGWSEIVIADPRAPEEPVVSVLELFDPITALRFSGDGALAFRAGDDHWLLHVASGVVRPLNPPERGALRAATNAFPPPRTWLDDAVGVIPLPEPETDASGFFYTDESGNEYRTGYEESGWDEALSPDEARTHAALLDRFVDGLQWPLRCEGAYEPFIASDDEPLRPDSPVPHLGLDLGSRLLHSSTGTAAFHVAGTNVYPLYRGGEIAFRRAVSLREPGPRGAPARREYAVLQEVTFREAGYVLRIHLAYEHVRPYEPTGLDVADPPASTYTVSGDEAVGGLVPARHGLVTGGWVTSDPLLRAGRIRKGNHVHVGIGGIFTSFNGSRQAAGPKLRWYRERLVPALRRAFGPR